MPVATARWARHREALLSLLCASRPCTLLPLLPLLLPCVIRHRQRKVVYPYQPAGRASDQMPRIRPV